MAVRVPEDGENRGSQIIIELDGQPVVAYLGETVATSLLAAGKCGLRRTAKLDEGRGMFCGMGVCFDCVMVVDGRPNVRACLTQVHEGMKVEVKRAGYRVP